MGTVTADLKLLLLTPPSCSRDWITVRARERGRDEPGLRQRGKVFVMSLFATLMHGALPLLEQETAGGPPHPSLQQCGAALSIVGQVRASGWKEGFLIKDQLNEQEDTHCSLWVCFVPVP